MSNLRSTTLLLREGKLKPKPNTNPTGLCGILWQNLFSDDRPILKAVENDDDDDDDISE